MALKDKWIDRVNGKDKVRADDVNMIAHAVMDAENELSQTATFIPSVDEESGVISWENNKGLPNPEPANIKGTNGKTPHIGDNGNWWIGDTDTGTKAQGEDGDPGANGKSAYAYAQDGGYTGTEEEFADKMAEDYGEDIEEIKDILSPLENEQINIFNYKDVTYGKKRSPNISHKITDYANNANGFYSNQIWNCKQGDVIRCSQKYVEILVYDSNGVCVSIYNNTNGVQQFTVSNANAAMFTYQCTSTESQYLSGAMITKNRDMPSVYIPYNEAEISLEKIGENARDIKALQNPPYFKKPFVALSFDAFTLSDNRFAIVNGEYGYKATIAHTTNEDTNKTVMKAGWDVGLYRLNGLPGTSGEYVSESPSESVIAAWDAYVNAAINEAEGAGVYNPAVWLARQGCSCKALEMALVKYGIPMCRGDYNPTYTNDKQFSPIKKPTMTVSVKQTVMPSTLSDCQTAIASAVEGGYGIAFLTHGIYDTDSNANSNYGVTEAVLRSFLDTIKGYVDAGQLEVLTYRDVYARYYEREARELDYNRLLKII